MCSSEYRHHELQFVDSYKFFRETCCLCFEGGSFILKNIYNGTSRLWSHTPDAHSETHFQSYTRSKAAYSVHAQGLFESVSLETVPINSSKIDCKDMKCTELDQDGILWWVSFNMVKKFGVP